MTFRVESSISGVLDPALSVQVSTSLNQIVSTATLKSHTRIVQRPSDLTNDEITIALNGTRVFTGFVDSNLVISDGQKGKNCEISLRAICAPTGESMICSERAISSEEDVSFRNSPLRSIVDNTMRWEEIDHPFVFRGDSANQIVRAFQWSYGEVFGDTISRLASERGITFTDTPEGIFQFIDFKAFNNEISHTIKESQCRHLVVKTDYDQRFRTYTGISRQDPISDVEVEPEIVSILKQPIVGGGSREVRVVTPARTTPIEIPVDDLEVGQITTFPRRKNWCRDFTSRELSADELRQAVDYEINRRRSSGTTATAVIPDLIAFRKGERVEFEFESEEFEGTPKDGWTIESVRWNQTGQAATGNLTTINCVPTQQFAIPQVDGAYDRLIGDE